MNTRFCLKFALGGTLPRYVNVTHVAGFRVSIDPKKLGNSVENRALLVKGRGHCTAEIARR
jgi:hypothetical protein